MGGPSGRNGDSEADVNQAWDSCRHDGDNLGASQSPIIGTAIVKRRLKEEAVPLEK